MMEAHTNMESHPFRNLGAGSIAVVMCKETLLDIGMSESEIEKLEGITILSKEDKDSKPLVWNKIENPLLSSLPEEKDKK